LIVGVAATAAGAGTPTPTRGGAPQTASRGTQPALIAIHWVRPGDTLLGIAWRYRVTVDMIKRANGLWTDIILPGQRLYIPAHASSTAGGVTITSLDDPFYGQRFLGVRRLLNP